MIAGADVGEHVAARDARSDRPRREDVVDPPADVALAHVPPRRPPGEERFVTRLERAADIDEMATEQTVEQFALLGALADDAGLALAGMNVDIGMRNIQVAAQHDLPSFRMQAARPLGEPLQERELRGVILAAVGDVHRRENEIVERDLHDPRFHVELGMREFGIGLHQPAADVQRHAGVPTQAVPVHVVVRELASLRDLPGLGLELLQAYDVGTVAVQPVAELRLARANAVDVPGRDFQVRLRASVTPSPIGSSERSMRSS